LFTLTINDKKYHATNNQTILSLAQREGIFIPSLCFSEKLPPSGACGLCLVEAEGATRPLRACAALCTEGMNIRTDTPRLRNMQKRILELHLSAHVGDCVAPCRAACPADTHCGTYIQHIAQGNVEKAVAKMYEAHPFPASIAYICPRPCEKNCRRNDYDQAVNIAGLKNFAVESYVGTYMPSVAESTGKHVAIVGGGPAGLTAAYFLRRNGHDITIYERNAQAGGLLRYGIPDYRLPKHILDAELAVLINMGIHIVTDMQVVVNLPALRADHHAVIIATGAGESKPLGCTGDNLPIVQGGTAFLHLVAMGYTFNTQINESNHVVVIGGSNTAIDAARTALRLNAGQVTIVYRRTRAEMPADPREINAAEAEGVQFKFLAAPSEVTPNGLYLQIMELGAPDESGRRTPVPIEGRQEWLGACMIISAIGQNVITEGFEEIETTSWHTLKAAPNTYATNLPGVYAIGDVTGQSAYAIEAIAHGREAANAVHAYICETQAPAPRPQITVQNSPPITPISAPRQNGIRLTPEQAKKEADRCLRCGCSPSCKLLSLINQLQITPNANPVPKPKTPNHDPNKCILCGLCIQACPKGILSLAHRSISTTLCTHLLGSPACENCTHCGDICPTGAVSL